MFSEPLFVVARVAAALDRLSIPYAVGGSLASSIHGIPRATQDADLVAALQPFHVQPLAAALSSEFYVDADSIANAVRRRTSFNILFLSTMFKVDIFVSDGGPWARQELKRAVSRRFTVAKDEVTVRFASPEDTVLHKLVWYKLGDQVSERQWTDILGVLRIQAGGLDEAYLNQWAEHLGVSDLLARARREGDRV
ncbi:MAG TPA: hypothetical protein VLV83_26545 [Acidobacteriota bacterium]|nr:hypothetical protein [Acidobacteriota bacterium]